MTTVKENELLACRICLAVDVELYDVRENKLLDSFHDLMGTMRAEWVVCPRHVCVWCRAQLVKSSELRRRCQHSQEILQMALADTRIVTMDYLRTIDRVAHKLSLNLSTSTVTTTDSTQPELVKTEQLIKEETEDIIENIFINEPIEFDNVNENLGSENNESTDNTDNYKLEEVTIQSVKRNRLAKTRRRNKTRHSKNNATKNVKCKLKQEVKKTDNKNKRVIKRRMADNGYLPDFNFEEFQSNFNVRIDILSREEQLREVEARKMAQSFALAAYGCDVCGKGFATKQVYDSHMVKHDVSAGAHACEICGVRFKTRSRTHVHEDTHRLRFTCEACGFVTRTRFIAKNHFLSHAGTTHKCPHCDAVFSKYTSYLTHVRRRHPAANTACEQCGETFVGRIGLRHHQARAHRSAAQLSVPQLQYKCVSCGEHFASKEARDRHAAAATADGCDDTMWPCPHCGAGLRGEAALGAHAREHHAHHAHLCRECNKWFCDLRSLTTHRARVHLNIRLKEPPRDRPRPVRAFICETCGNECTSLTNLVAHQRSHSGDKPHACPACALRFSSQHNMQRHHRVVHLGQRPQVKCDTCGKLLAHAASLKLHVNTVHLKLPLPPRQRRRDKSC